MIQIMSTKGGNTPPQVCQMGRAEIIYKLPSRLNCSGKEYEEWKVKLEKKNIKEYESKAQGLDLESCQDETGEGGTNVRTSKFWSGGSVKN